MNTTEELLRNPKAMKAIRKLIKLGYTAEAIGVLLAWHAYDQEIIEKKYGDMPQCRCSVRAADSDQDVMIGVVGG